MDECRLLTNVASISWLLSTLPIKPNMTTSDFLKSHTSGVHNADFEGSKHNSFYLQSF